MACPTVNTCCCCINLKDAGYLLGILGAIGAVASLATGYSYTAAVINLVACVLWLLGLRSNKPLYLLPTIVFGFLWLILVYLSPVIVILVIRLYPDIDEIQQFKRDFRNNKPIFLGAYILGVVIGTYIWIVEYSIFRRVKDIAKGRYDQTPDAEA